MKATALATRVSIVRMLETDSCIAAKTYSITSSAIASNFAGTSMPSILAV
jgi:hypothetical protein